MRDKSRNNILIGLADKVLKESGYLFIRDHDIPESYNRQVAAFGVSVAMSGLKPTVAIYYQDGETKVNRKTILAVLYEMLVRLDESGHYQTYIGREDGMNIGAKELLRLVINLPDYDKSLQKDIVDCSIALKQVIRTYKLI